MTEATTTQFDRTMSRINGAGVLPFMVSPTNELLFLLGKECHQPNYRGSNRWSAFEGGASQNESIVDTAVREYVEESMGCVRQTKPLELGTQLDNKDYSLSVCIRTPMHGGSVYVTFVKQFEYDDTVEHRFQEIRALLTHLHAKSVEVDALSIDVANIMPLVLPGDAIVKNGDTWCVDDLIDMRVDGGAIHLKYAISIGGVSDSWKATFDGVECDVLQKFHRLFTLRKEISQLLDECQWNLPKKACRVERSACGIVKTVKVNTDFLEKSCVRLWSASELKRILNERPTGCEVFRPYFLIVLERVLQEFQAL